MAAWLDGRSGDRNGDVRRSIGGDCRLMVDGLRYVFDTTRLLLIDSVRDIEVRWEAMNGGQRLDPLVVLDRVMDRKS